MTERTTDDPFWTFFCPKCGATTIRPRLQWIQPVVWGEKEAILIFCDDCNYKETRPTADAESISVSVHRS